LAVEASCAVVLWHAAATCPWIWFLKILQLTDTFFNCKVFAYLLLQPLDILEAFFCALLMFDKELFEQFLDPAYQLIIHLAFISYRTCRSCRRDRCCLAQNTPPNDHHLLQTAASKHSHQILTP
jgi:hypothetical protein